MMFKYWLFDWDGCLVDSLPVWFQGMKRGLSYFDVSLPDEEVKKGFQSWDLFVDLGVNNMQAFTDQVYGHVVHSLDQIHFNEGVMDLLLEIERKKLKAAIVTSTEQNKVLPVLKRLKAEHFFDCIVGRTDVQYLKPHAEPIEKALSHIQGHKTSSVIIGDSFSDIQAGKNAGISTVLFASSANLAYHPPMDPSMPLPDVTISHMGDLLEMV